MGSSEVEHGKACVCTSGVARTRGVAVCVSELAVLQHACCVFSDEQSV